VTVVLEARNRGGLPFSVILGEILPAALAVALLALVGIIHVTSRVLVVAQGYELSRLDAQSTELLRENDRLKLELATLKGPQKLESVARSQLGMVTPPPSQVFHVRK
jgi:cell division protein FtsL